MKKPLILAFILCAALINSLVFAQSPVNSICPVGKKAITDSGGTYEHNGETVGFCCPGCISTFAKWDDAKKDAFIAKAKTNPAPSTPVSSKGKEIPVPEPMVDQGSLIPVPYILDVCPISGGELGSMGDPVVQVYKGREVKFCCAMCLPTFEKDIDASLAKIDQQIIQSQIRYYPLEVCIVSGNKLPKKPVLHLYRNRLFQFCCTGCISTMEKSPKAYTAKLDAAVIKQQSKAYPLDECVISGQPLGSMGDPIEIVYAGRLIKFCCAMCVPQFEANPFPALTKIDKAWKAKHD